MKPIFFYDNSKSSNGKPASKTRTQFATQNLQTSVSTAYHIKPFIINFYQSVLLFYCSVLLNRTSNFVPVQTWLTVQHPSNDYFNNYQKHSSILAARKLNPIFEPTTNLYWVSKHPRIQSHPILHSLKTKRSAQTIKLLLTSLFIASESQILNSPLGCPASSWV